MAGNSPREVRDLEGFFRLHKLPSRAAGRSSPRPLGSWASVRSFYVCTVAKDLTGDPPALRALERERSLAVQKERRRQRDASARTERERERQAEVWRRDLAAYVMADFFDDDAPAVVHLMAGDAKRRLPARAEAVLVARRKAACDVRAASFGEAALAAGSSLRLAGFSDRTGREAAMVA